MKTLFTWFLVVGFFLGPGTGLGCELAVENRCPTKEGHCCPESRSKDETGSRDQTTACQLCWTACCVAALPSNEGLETPHACGVRILCFPEKGPQLWYPPPVPPPRHWRYLWNEYQ